MKERVLENWLDSAKERTFEIPFCFMLQAQGYTILHMTRHTGMEMGKDVLAIDSNGVPCAFQLKSSPGKRITLSQWRDEVLAQTDDLMMGKIVHPSLPSNKPHRSFLVTNRDLDEEVARAIDDRNRMWADRGHPEIQLETIVRGQLLKMASEQVEAIWPIELPDVKTLLELFLDQGTGPLDKPKVAHLLETSMGLHSDSQPASAEVIRAGASSALICALALSSWSRAENHVAEIEGWIIYVATLMGAAERWGVPIGHLRKSVALAETSVLQVFAQLCDDLENRSHLIEGNALADPPVHEVRVAQLIGVMSVYGLWHNHANLKTEHYNFIRKFCLGRARQMGLWGEGAVPGFLAYYWFLKEIDASAKSDFLIMSLLETLAVQNGARGPSVGDPYRSAEAIVIDAFDSPVTKAIEETAEPSGVSYMAKGLLHLAAKRNWKQQLRGIWPSLTRLGFLGFEPEEPWQYCLWRSEKGTNVNEHPPLTKQWADLRREAFACSEELLPKTLRQYPMLMLLFIIVYPHRATPDAVKWLDRVFRHF